MTLYGWEGNRRSGITPCHASSTSSSCSCWSVAVSTISRHSSRSYALCLADYSPRFCCLRSFSTVRSQVCRGQSRGRLHSFSNDITIYNLYHIDYSIYTVSQKNDTDVTHYRFNPHQPISVIFGRDVAERVIVCY